MHQKRLFGQDPLLKLDPRSLASKFRSKNDLYEYCNTQLQYYMPPKEKINRDFFKQVFAGQKHLIPRDQVRPIEMPKYDELSVAKLINEVMADPEYSVYFPEQKGKNSLPARDFFFNILNTVAPDYIKIIATHAHKHRIEQGQEEEKKDYIHITEQWKKELESIPFFSRKPGKTLMLLKVGAKRARSGFERKQIEVKTSLKAFKDEAGKIEMVSSLASKAQPAQGQE